MNNNDLLGRIHDLEAVVNGLMIYIAAKEAGVTLDPESEAGKSFLRQNVLTSEATRKEMYEPGPGSISADGHFDELAFQRIPAIAAKLRTA